MGRQIKKHWYITVIFAAMLCIFTYIPAYTQDAVTHVDRQLEADTLRAETTASPAVEPAKDTAAQEPDIVDNADTEEIAPAFSIPLVFSSFKMIPGYYGLPLSVQLGWFYRNRNTSIFPHTGMTFTVEDTPVLNTSAGFTFQHKTFTWYAAAVYDIVPFTMHKPAHEQIFYGTTTVSAALPNITISFPLRAGRQRALREVNSGSTAGSAMLPEPEKTTVTALSAGIKLDFFLADAGFFRSTGTAAFTYHTIPQDRFQYYTVTAGIPASFHLYYADIAFMYSFFYTDMLLPTKIQPLRRYEIGKTQETLSGRSSFKPLPRYRNMHLFGTECRWYPARLTAQTNGFFLSVFADAGLGITEAKKTGFLWECGGGIGYTLLDSVPFTIQAGINQNLQPVFYLTVVSRFVHLP